MKLFRNKLFIFALTLVLVCGSIMLYAAAHKGSPTPLTNLLGAVVTPIEKGFSKVVDGVTGVFRYFYDYDRLKAENEELRARIAKYEELETQFYAAVNENADLRAAANIRAKHKDFEMELCNVVSAVGSGFQSSFTIDKGTLSGIESGDCVITEQGLVGYISETGLNYAQVVTVLNMDFTVSATNRRTREVMVAGGDFALAGDGLLKASYLKNDDDIQAGDVILTNGAGGNYPKDLIIGTVETFAVEPHGISSYATIKPAVDFDSLSAVLVIKDFTIVE
ncbi:MAG: rod shape-determining protein MreC [Clostridiaceae bacterium]|nr:rod shape-determining protein MreC [Clostridiaceae bacterium]